MCVRVTLQPERGWEVDVDELASHADDDTSCVVVNNPSNPCGCVYTRRHLRDILRVAERLRLPIIADEIYADFVRRRSLSIVMAALWNRTDHYIFILFLSSFFFFYFLA